MYGVACGYAIGYGARMAKPKMTPAEARCFDVICSLVNEPSISDVAAAMGLTKAGAQRHMMALRLKGYLRAPRVVGSWAPTREGKSARKSLTD